jgi:hypothetical protein
MHTDNQHHKNEIAVVSLLPNYVAYNCIQLVFSVFCDVLSVVHQTVTIKISDSRHWKPVPKMTREHNPQLCRPPSSPHLPIRLESRGKLMQWRS